MPLTPPYTEPINTSSFLLRQNPSTQGRSSQELPSDQSWWISPDPRSLAPQSQQKDWPQRPPGSRTQCPHQAAPAISLGPRREGKGRPPGQCWQCVVGETGILEAGSCSSGLRQIPAPLPRAPTSQLGSSQGPHQEAVSPWLLGRSLGARWQLPEP